MSLPYHLASNNYAFQCLLPPTVVFTGEGDPQLKQIRSSLNDIKGSGALRIVDFGAGKGRLVEALSSGIEQDVVFDYVAFDPCLDDETACRTAIERLYGSSDSRYFNDAEGLVTSKGERWADCVVMTNVLHEIPVEDWLRVFSPNGLLSRIIKEDGFLLIVEDQQIPVGEMAHQNGFIILNTNELARLFAITESDRQAGQFRAGYERNGRLTAHLVSRRLFDRVSTQSRRSALEAVKALAGDRIVQLRSSEKSYRNGLLHGLWTQQLANATLALQQL
ncbi:hypothetical protein ARC02_07110 [Stenotrophomonas africana]|nr:hypothetical protein ARC02_07110 [Stenotrophomonas maltophilia]